MRKLLIGLISFVIVLVGFWVYIALMDTAPIQAPKATTAQDMEMPRVDTGMQSIGGTKLIDVGSTKFFKYDPVTKEVVAEYGFESLLNPGEQSSRWRAEKPYLIFYQADYQCRIESERGIFQVETVGSQSIPKDAQLDENVVIHITPNRSGRMTETTIYMDDLMFSSERSEFSTDGPVTIRSEQLRMEGYGLVLIFNMGQGKMEYLQIKDLDALRLKGFVSSETSLGVTAGTSGEKHAATSKPTASQRDTSLEKPDSSEDLYQCAIRDNVVIQYGNELVMSGADEVDILNIRFSSEDDKTSGTPEQTANAADTESDSQADQEPSKVVGTIASADDSKDVVVNCDGGMIIRPMQSSGIGEIKTSDSALLFEMSGAPLKIDRVSADSSKAVESLAHCGELYYKPAEDVLRLFTNARQPKILLNTEQSNSRIETNGNVFWDRKAQRANIAGPGKVYIGDARNPSAQPSEISFNGVMDLLFAQMPDNISSATIQTINLTGGMDAILRQNGTLKTLADSAVLEFGQENQLSEARLDGDVYFESLEEGQTASQAAAQSAVFHFDNNQIAMADLKGAVHFVSASGQMDSASARIEFSTDSNGTTHPKTIRTDGDSVLQARSDAVNQPAARFEAKKIDYDMQTGAGLAHGPIRFTFYELSGRNAGAVDTWVPVTITADENAEFLAGTDRMIRQIVFNKNVIALRIQEFDFYTQQDEFHGDKLIVDVGKNQAGSTAINRITFTEGKVFGQSKKLHGDDILFNVRLNCQVMTYDQSAGIVLAKGPGKIELDNSKALPTGSNDKGIDFQRPCYALIEGFDTIRWDIDGRQMRANGDERTLQFAYIPLVDGQVEKYIFVNSQELEASYQTDTLGKPSLNRIFTDKAITYVEKDGDNDKILRTLIGQKLEYDAVLDPGWLTITGSEAMPCMINNTRVPAIRYNINTGELKTSLSSLPGVITP